MQRTTLVAIGIIAVCVSVDVAWAILNYVIPILLAPPEMTVDLTSILPWNAVVDWLTLTYLIPLLSLPLYLVLGYITTRWLVLPLNKLLNPGKEEFYFGPETERPQPVLALLRRSFFAVLLMLGLALTITKFLPDEYMRLLCYTEFFDKVGASVYNEMNQAIILMPLIFPFLAFILPSSWLIEDCNIVFHSNPSSGPQELRNAGRTLITLLKGYAGIFVIIDYFRMAINISALAGFSGEGGLWPWVPPWFFYTITFINPLVFLFMPLSALLLYGKVLPSLRMRLTSYMERKGAKRLLSVVGLTEEAEENGMGAGEETGDTPEGSENS